MADETKTTTIGLAGLGFLGRGIAACLLSHGFRVIAYTTEPDSHKRARQYITCAVDELIANAGFAASVGAEWPERYAEAASLAEFAPCDFVIESVTEDLETKQRLFEEIEGIVAADTPIASNTSSISITLLQQGRKAPERFLGMHWAEPAYSTRFLELVRGEFTGGEAISRARELALRTGKDPCLVERELPGFIANRLAYAMYREAFNLLAQGVADIETIDRAFRQSVGLWAAFCGPFRWMDITGGPAVYGRAMQRIIPTLSNSTEPPDIMRMMIAEEWRGINDGRGFYSYEPDAAERWAQLLHHHAWIVRRLQDETRDS